MTGSAIVTAIVEILVSGITAMGQGIGTGLSSIASALFISGTDSKTLSVFGTLVIVFAAIALAMGLTRWVVNFVSSLGQRNR